MSDDSQRPERTMRSRSPLVLRPCAVSVGVLVVLVLVTGCLTWSVLPWHDKQEDRVSCRLNLRQIGIAMFIWAPEHENAYPWHIGRSNPHEAWRDIGLLYPSYVADFQVFYCPGSTDEIPEKTAEARGESRLWAASDIEVIIVPPASFDPSQVISYAYCFDARNEARTSWKSNAPNTLRLSADKKAGITIEADDLDKASHNAEGRNVLYLDTSVKWQAGLEALDPDEDDNDIGKPGTKNFSDWWSDPPWYDEDDDSGKAAEEKRELAD